MAEQVLLSKIKNKYKLASAWQSANPILLAGEIGVESDTNLFKIGNGTSTWNELPYYFPKQGGEFTGDITGDVKGNADTATKLATTVNISLSGVTATAQPFDGSADVTIPVTAVPKSVLPSDVSYSGHTHDAADIVSGTISIERLPHGALERLIVVPNDAARFALTSENAQVGDTVKVSDTGITYFVVDESKLNEAAGYEEYTAATATSVPWSGITGKPESFTPSAHTHVVSDITDFPDDLVHTSNVATETSSGIVRLSNSSEATAGTDNTTAMTPAKVQAYVNAKPKITVSTTEPQSPVAGDIWINFEED